MTDAALALFSASIQDNNSMKLSLAGNAVPYSSAPDAVKDSDEQGPPGELQGLTGSEGAVQIGRNCASHLAAGGSRQRITVALDPHPVDTGGGNQSRSPQRSQFRCFVRVSQGKESGGRDQRRQQ